MKHLILGLSFALILYFGWQYLPSPAKSTAKDFLERHAIKVIAIWVAFWGALFLAVNNGSINIV